VDVRKYGSQGQQRTAALSLKLSEVDLYRDRTGESPILLLDDVFSELDAERTERLVAKIDGVQSIITCTEPSVVNNGKVKYFNVHAGLVTPK
jgi:DNA replication and repair protein RecF